MKIVIGLSLGAIRENSHYCSAIILSNKIGEIYMDFARFYQLLDSYLFEDFDESPIFDIRLLVGGKDKNLSTEGANGNKAAVWAPCEALNTRKDAVGSRRGLRFLVHHD